MLLTLLTIGHALNIKDNSLENVSGASHARRVITQVDRAKVTPWDQAWTSKRRDLQYRSETSKADQFHDGTPAILIKRITAMTVVAKNIYSSQPYGILDQIYSPAQLDARSVMLCLQKIFRSHSPLQCDYAANISGRLVDS